MNGPEHYREAERLLGEAQKHTREGFHVLAGAAGQRAGVHATLALAAATAEASGGERVLYEPWMSVGAIQ